MPIAEPLISQKNLFLIQRVSKVMHVKIGKVFRMEHVMIMKLPVWDIILFQRKDLHNFLCVYYLEKLIQFHFKNTTILYFRF